MPGSVAVARFGPGEAATRFRVLAEQTRGLDGPPSVAVAETATELGDIWHQYDLPGAPPPVDFDQDLVLAFTEHGFCNDGRLEGFALTSAGELLPRVRWSERECDSSVAVVPQVRVYVAALGRSALARVGYSLRWFMPETFTVRSPRPAAAPALPPQAPLTPPPPDPDAAAPRHARHALVVEGGSEDPSLMFRHPGVWVRSDAVWVLDSSGSAWGPYWAADEDAKQRVCDREACTRVLARTRCSLPECPATGTLLFAERPLGVREPWPTEAAAWERLVRGSPGTPRSAS